MIIHEHNGYKHEISRASYTKLVWKVNHYVFGRWTPGCWNTVHCGKRDYSYKWAYGVSTSHACQIMQISKSEFQFFFEKTDQASVNVYIEANQVHFYWKGKSHTITRGGDKSKVIALLKQIELYGNADANRMEKKAAKAAENASKPKSISSALQAKRAAAVARTAELMRPDYVAPKKSEPVVFNTTLAGKPIQPAEHKHGCPLDRILEFRSWTAQHHKDLLHIKMPERVVMFLADPVPEPVDLLSVAQMFEPLPEYLLLPAPLPLVPPLTLPLLIYAEKGSSESEVAITKPGITIAEPVKAVTDEKKAPIVLVCQRKPQQGMLYLRKKRVRKLIDHEEKADVQFYGKRRRTQAQFRDTVALNCFDCCVISGASLIRCEAAHILAHARKGGASFKNGLLMRADLHTLFDAGECAIDPQTMTIHFSLTILESDPDLAVYEGKAICTLKPINGKNLEDRWTEFLTVYMDANE